jgi:solute carrier family 25 thiamine pyrophosphate transporter 19
VCLCVKVGSDPRQPSLQVPAVLFWMPYTAVQFAVLEQCNAALAAENSRFSRWDSSAKQFVGGAVAGVAATVASYPLDLIRTNFAAQGEPRVYHSIAGAAWGIARQRGVTGLYAGMGATLLEIIPHSGLQFAAYDLLKRAALRLHRQPEGGGVRTEAGGSTEGAAATLTVREKFVCGLLAGSLAKSAIHPLDVVKKRFQVAGLRRSSTYGAC